MTRFAMCAKRIADIAMRDISATQSLRNRVILADQFDSVLGVGSACAASAIRSGVRCVGNMANGS